MGFKHPTFRMWCTRSNRLLYRRDHRKEWLYWIHIYTHICHVFLKIRNLRILRLLLFPRTSCVHHIITNFCKYRMYCYPFFYFVMYLTRIQKNQWGAILIHWNGHNYQLYDQFGNFKVFQAALTGLLFIKIQWNGLSCQWGCYLWHGAPF